MKADKNKAMVLIDRKQGIDKVHKSLKDNGISTIKQDPTTKFHKQIQKTIKSCTQLVGKKNTRIFNPDTAQSSITSCSHKNAQNKYAYQTSSQ